MKICFTSCLLLISIFSQAQLTENKDTIKVPSGLDDSVYQTPAITATFIKGDWMQWLERKMDYPANVMRKEIQGTVIVQFIIERNGSVSNIQSVSGPKELFKTSEDLIRKSPKWTPAQNNGVPVRSMIRQPIVYRLTK